MTPPGLAGKETSQVRRPPDTLSARETVYQGAVMDHPYGDTQ